VEVKKMKKSVIGIILVLALLCLPAVLAQTCDPVYVSGEIITNDNIEQPVDGATVDVYCNSNLLSTTSLPDGSYAVKYVDCACKWGDSVTVTATKGSATGSNTGTVNWDFAEVDISVVNVSIPEFGVIAASVAMIGALGGLVLFRRH
jgi:hypothetical protein